MIVSFVLIFMIFSLLRREEYAKNIAYSCVLWTLFVYFVTELLSCFKAMRFVPLLITWILLDVSLLIAFIVILSKNRQRIKEIRLAVKVSFNGKVLRIVIYVALCIMMLYLACNIVPYNWDSMTYHCARIANWAQNGTVAHYATSIERQICSPALTEFVNLNIFILMRGNDILFNCIQCVSYLLCVMYVYKVAQKIGCDDRAAVFASILYAASPTCFAEALSTQVDEFSALWMVIFIYIIIDYVYEKEKLSLSRDSFFKMFIISLTVAFGFLSKPTVVICMLVFTAWLVIRKCADKDNRRLLFVWVITVLVMTVVLISPELIRNLVTYHAFSSPIQGKGQMVGTIDPRYLLVGMLKNLFYNVPSIFWPWASGLASAIVYWTAYHLGINADSEMIAESAHQYEFSSPYDYSYDTSVNPVIIALFFLCLVVYFIRLVTLIKRKRKFSIGYSAIAFLSFIIFCAILRWEGFVSRYMIAYFAVLCPAIALQIQKWFEGEDKHKKNQYIRGILSGMVFFMCLVDFAGLILYHADHVFNGENRNEGYFEWNGEEYSFDNDIATLAEKNGWKNIGLNLGTDSYEYPIWRILGNDEYTIKHVNVNNETAKYEDNDFIPDCIIVIDNDINENEYICHGKIYHHIYKYFDNYYLVTE